MDTSQICFNELLKIVELQTRSHSETIQSIQYLIDNGFIRDNDFHRAIFTYKHSEGARVQIDSDYIARNYRHIILHSIDFNRVDPSEHDFSDVECAVAILKKLHLYVLDSIEDILRDKANYIYNKELYSISISKNGMMRWEGRFGAGFIYN